MIVPADKTGIASDNSGKTANPVEISWFFFSIPKVWNVSIP